MKYRYFLWQRNDPEQGEPVPSWIEITEDKVPKPPDSRIFAVIRISEGGATAMQTEYLNWDGSWFPFLGA